MSKLYARALAVVAAIGILAGPSVCQAKTEPRHGKVEGEAVQSLLFVGNSYYYFNNGIHRYVNGLSNADKSTRLRSVLVGIGGSGIDWHDVDSYLRPGSRLGSYSFIQDNKIRFNPPGRQFDVMIMMDCSQCPVHPELKGIFREFSRKHSDTARKYGVRPVFFMSWAYKDAPEMTAELAEAYTNAGNENDALVIPVGLAYATAVKARSDLEFYQPDKRHPTLIGTYLAACVTYAALTGKSPVGSSYTAGLDSKLAEWLQSVAWDTVNEYYATAKAKLKQPAG